MEEIKSSHNPPVRDLYHLGRHIYHLSRYLNRNPFNQALDAFCSIIYANFAFFFFSFLLFFVLNAGPDVFSYNQMPYMLLVLLLKAVQTCKSCVAPSLCSLLEYSCEAKVRQVIEHGPKMSCFSFFFDKLL